MIKLFIEDMSCQHCVNRIKQALEERSFKAEVDLATKTVVISENDIEIEEFIASLDELGYSAKVLT